MRSAVRSHRILRRSLANFASALLALAVVIHQGLFFLRETELPMKPKETTPSRPLSLSAELAATAQHSRSELQYHEGQYYLLERRPDDQGRTVLLRVAGNQVEELLPPAASARSRVHEYGGGTYLVCGLGIYYVDELSQQIMCLEAAGRSVAVTEDSTARFGGLCAHEQTQQLIAVRETHGGKGVVNELVAVCLSSGAVSCLATGEDFYAAPAVNRCGTELAFISWCHPDMPWLSNKLWRAQINADGKLIEKREVASRGESSKGQPHWGGKGELLYLDDRSGWWNIWLQSSVAGRCEHLLPIEEDLGRAQWELSSRSYLLCADNVVYAIASSRGKERLLCAPLGAEGWADAGVDQVQLSWLCATQGSAAYLGGNSKAGVGVYDLGGAEAVLMPAAAPLSTDVISTAESISFKTRGGGNSQGFFYTPAAMGSTLEKALPPLVVVMHGGPTTACGESFKPLVQYWTSRGFAVFDINYRGSTGFGREYRLALGGQWGVADVEDCVDGVRHLVQSGLVDSQRVAIRGGSAGGFTALAAVVSSDVFAVAACHYGIGDLELLAGDTHKFESRYLDHLIGPYPASKAVYRERSPIHHLDAIDCPIFISHGRLDHVVPVNQAIDMHRALKSRGLLVELLVFEDERHGYAKKENIAAVLDAELAFFKRAFKKIQA